MLLIFFYSLLLIGGMIISQTLDLMSLDDWRSTATTICLAYIMIEVGLEFSLDKTRIKSYAWDFGVSMTAAVFPWLFCAAYFFLFFHLNIQQSLLVGLFAAPTSAGVLFTMLGAAGLGASWLFQKARVLAVFDDLGTILLLVPIQIISVGFRFELIGVLILILLLLWAAYRFLHFLALPVGKVWLFFYGMTLVALLTFLQKTTHIHLEILLPAFTLGCILKDEQNSTDEEIHEHTHLEPLKGWPLGFDRLIKGSFMLLVGCSLPQVETANLSWGAVAGHVLALTLLSNLGKCFPMFCYRQEVSVRQRVALGIAMFPRGEVGAGVILIALSYGLTGIATSLAVLSLALNLVLTGLFVWIVIWLLGKPKMSG